MTLTELFEKTSMADKAACLSRLFEKAQLDTYERWQNAPTRLGLHVCGESVYSVVAELNRVADEEVDEIPHMDEAGDPSEGPDEDQDDDQEGSIFKLNISEKQAQALARAGFMTIASLKGATVEELEALDGIGEVTAKKLVAAN